jgi:hypothetical protein
MPEHAYRACPHCGTHNRHYMLVCTRCTRSLQGVALVGTPPPGSEIRASSDRLLRITLGALALLAAATVVVLLSRLLRTGAVEGRAAAADGVDRSRPPSPPAAAPPGAWETLEERWAERPPIPAPSASPSAAVPATPVASASAPVATPVASVSPAVALTTAPSIAPAAPPPAVPAPAVPSPATATAAAAVEGLDPPPGPRPRATPRARPATSEAEPADDVGDDEAEPPTDRAGPLTDPAIDPDRAKSERRAALRRAEDRLQRLEGRAEELRDRIAEEDGFAETGQSDSRLELAKVLRRIEQAEREVIRAEWALRAVEP